MPWIYKLTNIVGASNVTYNMRCSTFLFFFMLVYATIGAQDTSNVASIIYKDSVPSLEVSKSLTSKDDFKPIPKKALLYSLLFPGGGQIYNRKYWKLPLVYGAYGGVIYAIDFNTRRFNRFRTAHLYLIDDDPNTIDEFTERGTPVTADQLRRIRNSAQKDMEVSYLFTVIVHVLSGLEAYVDAHLMDFDISDDLSMRIRPTFDTNLLGSQVGVGLSFSF